MDSSIFKLISFFRNRLFDWLRRAENWPESKVLSLPSPVNR